MVSKKKPSAEKSEEVVTRITASDTKNVSERTPNATQTPISDRKKRNPLKAIGGYFKGSWYELKQVRWPNRRATWGMTLAVLAYTAFFALLILILDALFKYVFQLILGS